jgi:2-dehydropantoate 2-reductase
MKVAVMGAGAVGGYFGGLLAKGGADVTFIARGKHLEALKAKGLTVRSVKGDFSLPVKATDDPREVGPVNLVLFCVKSYDTEAAMRQALPMVGKETVVLSLQNGIDNEEKIASIVGKEKVLAGVAYIGSSVAEPGVILHEMEGKIAFGEMDGGVSNRVLNLKEFFDRCGLTAEASADIRKALWAKLTWNAPFNAINALVGGLVKAIVENPQTLELAKQVTAEVVAVASASGIPLTVEEVWARNLRFVRRSGIKSSMLQDLELGRPLEHEALNGIIVKKGAELGIPTPYNFALYALLSQLQAKP